MHLKPRTTTRIVIRRGKGKMSIEKLIDYQKTQLFSKKVGTEQRGTRKQKQNHKKQQTKNR